MQKVGILGSGVVAKALAVGFKQHGDDVMVGSRSPEKLADWAREQGVATGDFAATAAFGEVVVLAVAGTAAEQALALAGDRHLAGKVVVDTTNPIAEDEADRGVLRYFTGPNESLMERLQKAHPDARFVKAFNSVGNAFMVNPNFAGGPPTMFICGNDAAAKRTVGEILTRFGWAHEDAGFAESARPIEALCQLWCARGFLQNQWAHAFQLLKA